MKKEIVSSALSQEVVSYLSRRGERVGFATGDVIVRRGEPGRAFFVILEGRVEIRLRGEDDRQLPLVRLADGAFFGEMALITGDPVSADVVALGPVTLLRYPGELFNTALAECEPLRTEILSGLAGNLRRSSTDVWNFFQRAQALHVLSETSWQSGPLIARSSNMRRVEEAIMAAGGAETPLLVTGAAGAGKLFVAAKVHQASPRRDAPFIVIDCRSLNRAEVVKFLFGSSRFFEETHPVAGFGALQHYGAVHLANNGTLVLRHVETLPPEAQELLVRYLTALRERTLEYPVTRVIATTGEDLARLAAAERFDARLQEFFSADPIAVPRLGERRKDILPLARVFLGELDGGGARVLSTSAAHSLVSQRYSHRNAAELREAVELGALFAEDEEIRAEHIFTGPKEEGTPLEFEIGQMPLVGRLISPGAIRTLRTLVLLIFGGILYTGLFLPGTPAGRFANALTWSLWEPALFLAFFLAGRLWCTVCPLSAAGRFASRIRNLGLPPPTWMKKYTAWIVIAGFGLIIWAEHVFEMTARPFAAGILLGSLLAGAVVSALIFQRESWCRFLCPLGNLGAVYAVPAPVNVHANPSVCATYCTTHDCFKGSKRFPGCPTFRHPLYSRDGQFCKLCLNCLRSCPHGSARLYLKPPVQSVWKQGDLSWTLTPFALFLFFVSLFLLASHRTGWGSSNAGFTAAVLTAAALAAILHRILPGMLLREADPEPDIPSRVSFSLLILSWGPAVAYQLEHIGWLRSFVLRTTGDAYLGRRFPTLEIPLLTSLQIGVILLAALGALAAFKGVRRRQSHQESSRASAGWAALAALCAVYTAGAVGLVLFPAFR